MNSAHPTRDLVFIIIDEERSRFEEKLEQLIRDLASSGKWSLQPPEVVEIEGEDRVGGLLRLYSELTPRGEALSIDSDAANLDEVTRLVEALTTFSSENHLEIEFELDGECVGDINGGQLSKSLAVGLLGEWRRVLNERIKAQ